MSSGGCSRCSPLRRPRRTQACRCRSSRTSCTRLGLRPRRPRRRVEALRRAARPRRGVPEWGLGSCASLPRTRTCGSASKGVGGSGHAGSRTSRRRDLHGAREHECGGDDPIQLPGDLPGPRGRRRAGFAGGRRGSRGDRVARRGPAPRDGCGRRGRPPRRRVRVRPQRSCDLVHTRDPVRREDRRGPSTSPWETAYPETEPRTAPRSTGT